MEEEKNDGAKGNINTQMSAHKFFDSKTTTNSAYAILHQLNIISFNIRTHVKDGHIDKRNEM